jgi:hypothetical protein
MEKLKIFESFLFPVSRYDSTQNKYEKRKGFYCLYGCLRKAKNHKIYERWKVR